MCDWAREREDERLLVIQSILKWWNCGVCGPSAACALSTSSVPTCVAEMQMMMMHCSAGWARHKANMSSACWTNISKSSSKCMPSEHTHAACKNYACQCGQAVAGGRRQEGVGVWHGKNRWLNANKHNWISLVSVRVVEVVVAGSGGVIQPLRKLHPVVP